MMVYLALAISVPITLLLTYSLACSTLEKPYDTETSRLLLHTALVSVILCMVLSLTLAYLSVDDLTSFSLPSVGEALAFLFLIAIPGRIIWNYLRIPGRIVSGYNARRIARHEIPDWLQKAFSDAPVSLPKIYRSSKAAAPVIFGRSSRRPFLIIPDTWLNRDDISSPPPSLLHEIGHLENRDVGFLTWGAAFLRGAFWPAAISFVISVASLFWRGALWNIIGAGAGVHFLAVLHLSVLIAVVSRDRERLADIYARSRFGRKKTRLARKVASFSLPSPHGSRRYSYSRHIFQSIRTYLEDKAYFSDRNRFWKLLHRAYSYVRSRYPIEADKDDSGEASVLPPRPNLGKLETSLWAGLSLGLFTVTLIATGGLWSIIIGQADTSTEILALPFWWYLAFGLLLPAYLASLLVIPEFYDQLNKGRWAHQLSGIGVRHAVAGVTACAGVVPLALCSGILADLGFLWGLALVLVLIAVTVSFALGSIGYVLWRLFRHWTQKDTGELYGLVKVSAPALLVILALFAASIYLLFYGGILGRAVFVGLLAGFPWNLLCSKGMVSWEDTYGIIKIGWRWIRCEGKEFEKRSWAMLAVTLLGPLSIASGFAAAAAFAAFHFGLFPSSSIPVFLLATVILLVETCVFAGCRKQLAPPLQEKKAIHHILAAHRLLVPDKPYPEGTGEILDTYMRGLFDDDGRPIDPRMSLPSLYLVAQSAQWAGNPDIGLDSARNWIKECARKTGGFGPWPGATARLSCTCYAFEVLSPDDPETGSDRHIAWIRRQRRSGGHFDCPHSRRPSWEDTYFAVRSLYLADCELSRHAATPCATFMSDQLRAAKDTDEVIKACCCLKVLEYLGERSFKYDEAIKNWLARHLKDFPHLRLPPNTDRIRSLLEISSLLHEDPSSVMSSPTHETLLRQLREAVETELS